MNVFPRCGGAPESVWTGSDRNVRIGTAKSPETLRAVDSRVEFYGTPTFAFWGCRLKVPILATIKQGEKSQPARVAENFANSQVSLPFDENPSRQCTSNSMVSRASPGTDSGSRFPCIPCRPEDAIRRRTRHLQSESDVFWC